MATLKLLPPYICDCFRNILLVSFKAQSKISLSKPGVRIFEIIIKEDLKKTL